MPAGPTTVPGHRMHSRRAVPFLIAACLLLVGGVHATYAGDRPLAAVYKGDIHGNYVYTTGTSVYSSGLKPGDSCNATFTITLPQKSTPAFSRLYVYWGWSRIDQKAVYPVLTLSDTRDPATPLNLTARYIDSKGFVSAYDFYSGTDAYAMPELHPGQNTITVVASQDGPEGSSVLIFGLAALVVYQSPDEQRRLVWVKEGCDLMFSSYGVSPEMASSDMVFEGSIPKGEIESAKIFLVAPSAGYSRDLEVDINKLLVNRLDEEQTPPLIRTIFSLLFPNYSGKEWRDIFSPDNATQIGFETKEIRPYLKPEDNRVTIRDQGDYFQLTNAILTVSMAGESA